LTLGDDEDGNARILAELRDIVDVAVADHPANVLRDGSLGDAAKAAGSDRFDEKSAGRDIGAGLNDFEELLALRDGVIVGEEKAEIDIQLCGGGLGDERLLVLISVVIGQGYHDAQSFVQAILRAVSLDSIRRFILCNRDAKRGLRETINGASRTMQESFLWRKSPVSADQRNGADAIFGGAILPGVACAVLDDAVAHVKGQIVGNTNGRLLPDVSLDGCVFGVFGSYV